MPPQDSSLLGFPQGDHLLKDAAMRIEEEILGPEVFDGGVERLIVQQDGAKDGALRVQMLREGTFESGFVRHGECEVYSLFLR